MPLLEPGQTLGTYTAVRFIDEGGNGEVWEVVDGDGTVVALKILLDRRATSVAYRRFQREIETVRSMGERPGILPILDAHLPEQPSRRNRAWYTMPLVDPLAGILENRPVPEVVAAVAALAEVLVELHAQGIAHRDIKPANLHWRDARPLIGDFGLVHIPDAESLTETGRVPGGFGYIADEVMVDPDAADPPPADVFALGKVLWKLLTVGALFPPQGSLRADGGPSTLSRSLTVAHAGTLDRVLAAATAPVDNRIEMGQLAGELRAWLAMPVPAGFPQGLDAALDAARRSMDPAVRDRERTRGVGEEADQLRRALVDRCEGLFTAVASIDSGGAQVGALAAGRLIGVLEQPPETGRPLYGQPFHHGVRITRARGPVDEDVLIIAFCMQVSNDAEGVITGLLLSGDEGSTNCMFRRLGSRRTTGTVELEVAINEIVADAEGQLTAVLEDFTSRGSAR